MAPLFFLSCWIVITSAYAFIIPNTLDTNTKFTWAKAEEYCMKQFHSNLASIHSNFEYQTVLQLTSELNLPSNFWIGLTINTSSDLPVSDDTRLAWTDGTNVTWTDEPFGVHIHSNNSVQYKKCVTIYWDIVDCNSKYWPICNEYNTIETTHIKTEWLTNTYTTETSLKHKKKGLIQIILNDEWLLLGLCLFAGFLGIGIMYCFIIFFCVCYLNLKLRINANTNIRKKINMDFGITIAKHYNETNNVIISANGEVLSGVKHKHKYKQRTLNIPVPKSKSKSKSKTKSNYSQTMHTSVNVRPPNSNRSHLSCTDAASEDISLMTGLSINGIMKDIIPAIDIDTSTEYLQINNGRMMIGDVRKRQDETQSGHETIETTIDTDEQKTIDVNDEDLNSDEIAIKENIFSIERNLHLLQDMNHEEESEPPATNDSDTEYYDNNLFI